MDTQFVSAHLVAFDINAESSNLLIGNSDETESVEIGHESSLLMLKSPVSASSDLKVAGSLDVTGLAAFNAVSLNQITSSVTMQRSLTVTGLAAFNTVSLNQITSPVSMQSSLTVTGPAAFNLASMNQITSPVTMQSSLTVTGATVLNNAVTLGQTSSAITVRGTLNALRPATFDRVTINGSLVTTSGVEFQGQTFGVYADNFVNFNVGRFYLNTEKAIFEMKNDFVRMAVASATSTTTVFRSTAFSDTIINAPDNTSTIEVRGNGHVKITNIRNGPSVFESVYQSNWTAAFSPNQSASLHLHNGADATLNSSENIVFTPGPGKAVSLCGYSLPNTIGQGGQVLTSDGLGASAWAKPIAFAQTFGGVGTVDEFLPVNGLYTTPAYSLLDQACVFVVPIACNLTKISFNTEATVLDILKNNVSQGTFNVGATGVQPADIDCLEGDMLAIKISAAPISAHTLVTCLFK